MATLAALLLPLSDSLSPTSRLRLNSFRMRQGSAMSMSTLPYCPPKSPNTIEPLQQVPEGMRSPSWWAVGESGVLIVVASCAAKTKRLGHRDPCTDQPSFPLTRDY